MADKKPPLSKLDDNYKTYPTPQAAAIAALRGIGTMKVESAGGILYNKDQNVYAPTGAVPQDDDSHFAVSVGMPKGWQLHSTYHTHPSGDKSTMFSDGDINTAKQLNAPSYILSQDDNKIHMFDPNSSKVQKLNSSGRYNFSYGSPVDETPPKAADAPATADAPTTPAPAATTPVTGDRITMKDFANRHRAKTTKYRHRVIHIRTK
jgi:hypothetical protein